ncbi:hypothetical protein F6V30_02445 [Oryzomonas sagensis]|uniref:Carboxypeptidase regulatory-like domain-containing protein n=1 Tax=Oryzomonas sagensis TaxID=2603857 RepID=A0ABQ6TRQ0_9BACT|nr:hypothetical protein [Oryzomonas sagensis]KAB0671459.1 hypothetical protein F6V30_02445 [Oryzomonas sagensis]
MNVIKGLVLLGMVLALSACGSGDYGNSASTVVSGVASAGIISGGTVKVFAAYSSANEVKKQLGSTGTTDANGIYKIDIGSYTGPVIVEVTGGSYTDEATSPSTMTIPAAAPLRAAVNAAGGPLSVAVTPLTELALRLAKTAGNKLTKTNIDAANSMISQLFKMDIIATLPVAPTATAFSAATQAQKDYALALATISQFMKTNSSTDLSAQLGVLLEGIGLTTGMSAGTTTNLTTALSAFLADTTHNQTGVTTVFDTGLQNIGTTTMTLTLALSGTNVASVKAIQTTINLPTGIKVRAHAITSGEPLDGVLTPLAGSTSSLLNGSYTSTTTPATLKLNFATAGTGNLVAGDIIRVVFDVTQGTVAPLASAFSLTNTVLVDANTADVTGVTLSVHK